MLLDLALLPEVFETSAYTGEAGCGGCLKVLKPVLLTEAVVRDLRNGAWRTLLGGGGDRWHPATKELIESLRVSGRLCVFPNVEKLGDPGEAREWCYEALATHAASRLDAILCTDGTGEEFSDEPLVQSVEEIHDSKWYLGRTCSVRLRRRSEDYLTHLRTALRWCNSAMFIDPHLDPSRQGYGEFYQLLETARTRECKPSIELHRALPFVGTGMDRRPLSRGEIEDLFKPLADRLFRADIRAEVFIWDTMHDRYLITNLIGISLPNGFDTSPDATDLTTWSRLSPRDREDIQREFDPASRRHQLRYYFDIGKPDE